jgi:NDP-sugar pyrophosphorylase family protein
VNSTSAEQITTAVQQVIGSYGPEDVDANEVLVQTMIEAGYQVTLVPVHGGWVEVDTVSDLESATTRSRLNAIAQE